MHSYINICPCMHICVCVCIYRAPNYPGRPHPEGGVGGEPKKKGGTQNSSKTQRISRKCGALLAVLTGNLWAAGSITLATQGRGGDWSRQRATSSCLKSKKVQNVVLETCLVAALTSVKVCRCPVKCLQSNMSPGTAQISSKSRRRCSLYLTRNRPKFY